MTTYDLADLTPLVNQILFGTPDNDDESIGGFMTVLSLDEDHVTEANDPRDRPKGLFLTYHIHRTGSPVYGLKDQQYLSMEDDPEDENALLQVYDNAFLRRMTIGIFGPADKYTDLQMNGFARLCQRHAISVTNRELKLLGLDARIIDQGEIRDATTVFNRDVERAVKFELSLLVGETFSVSIAKFDQVSFTTEEGLPDEEDANPTREEGAAEL